MADTNFTSAGGGSASDPLLQYYQGAGSNSALNPFAIRPNSASTTGYAGFGQGQTGQAAQWPYANSQNTFTQPNIYGNGIYSSIYGGSSSPVYNPITNSYNSQTGGAPSWNGSSWVTATGQPYTGTYNGQTFNQGQSYQQMANDPNSRYQSIGIVKNPGVASATDSLTSAFKPTAGISDFSDLLNGFRTATGAATKGFASDQSAYNIQPLADTLNSLNAGYANTTGDLNSRYSSILGNQTQQENDILGQANTNLGQYDTAVTNVGNLAQNALQQQVSRYKLGSGTPMSLGGGEEAMLINGTNAIQVPLALDKINAQQNLLLGTALPLAQGQNQRQIQQLTGFTQPMAQQNYQNATQTAQLVKNLQIQTAGMSIADAANYMRTLGIPDQTIQQIQAGNQGLQAGDISNLSGLNSLYSNSRDISNLSGLNSLYSNSRYQGLQDKMGANLSQPTVSTFSPGGAGSYPGGGGSRYGGLYPTMNTGTGGGYGGANYQSAAPGGAAAGGGVQYLSGQSEAQLNAQGLTSIGNGQFYDMYSGNIYGPTGQLIQQYDNSQAAAPVAAPDYSTTPGGGGGYGGSGAGGGW